MTSTWPTDLYSAIIDTMSALVVVLNRQGRIVRFNQACEQSTGYRFSEVEGRLIWDLLLLPEERPAVVEVFAELKAGLFPNRFTNNWVAKDGSPRLIEWANTALLDADGQVEYIVGTGIDVTASRRAEETVQRRDAILEAVAFAAEEFLKTADWERSTQQVLARLAIATGASHAYIAENILTEDGARAIAMRHEWALPGTEVVTKVPAMQQARYRRMPRWEALLSQGQSIHGRVKDLPEEERAMLLPRFQAVAVVPVFVEDMWWGYVGFAQTVEDRPWQASEVDALRAAAGTFGAALSRRRSIEERQSQERYLTVLADITRVALETPNTQAVLQKLADRLAEIIGADGCFISLWDERRQLSLPAAASAAFRDAYIALGPRPAAESVVAYTLQLGRTWAVDDISTAPEVFQQPAALFHVRSGIGVPLVADAKNLGSYFLTFSQPHRFSQEEIVRCERAARQIALSIAKAQSLESERRARRRAETLQAATQALSSSLDLQHVLDTIMTELQHVVNYDSASVQQVVGDRAVIVACRGFANDDEMLGLTFNLTRDDTPNKMVVQSRVPLVLADAPLTYAGFETVPHVAAGIRSWLSVPLLFGDQVIGLITLDKKIPGYYNQEHVDLALAFAAQATVAFVNARLFDEAQRRASQQEALNSIIAAAATALSLTSLTQIALESLLRATNLEQGGIWVAGHYHRIKFSPEMLGIVAEFKQGADVEVLGSMTIADWSEWLDVSPLDKLARPALNAGIRSSFFTPVMADEQQIGGLALCGPVRREWPPEEVMLLEACARQLGAAAQRLRLTEQVQKQAYQLQQILDTVADGMLLLDADRRIVLANPPVSEFLDALGSRNTGDVLEHLGGMPLSQLLDPQAHDTWHELVVERPTRRIFLANARPTEYKPEGGGWVLSISEVTLERKMQEHVQEQDRLAALGRMAAGIAHDFNNILQGMIGLADIVGKTSNLPPAAQRRLQLVSQEGRRGAELVRQILDFSRQSPPVFHVVDMEPLLQYFINLWRATLPSNIQITTRLTGEPCLVRADANQLEHVFTNLATNAAEAMPQGGVLAIELSRYQLQPRQLPPLPTMQPGTWVAVTVSDTGQGIAAEHLPRIFEPFFTTKLAGRSRGLGLARVYGIVQAHDGFIRVESQVDAGSRFTVYLPAISAYD